VRALAELTHEMASLLKGYIPAFLNPETIFSGVVALSHAS